MTRTLIALMCSLALVATLPACKKSADSAGGSSGSSSKSSGKANPSGTYAWASPEGTISIEFLGDGKCRMNMTEGGSTETNEASYTINANTVVVQSDNPGSLPMTLRLRDDGNFDCNFAGMEAVFVKQ